MVHHLPLQCYVRSKDVNFRADSKDIHCIVNSIDVCFIVHSKHVHFIGHFNHMNFIVHFKDVTFIVHFIDVSFIAHFRDINTFFVYFIEHFKDVHFPVRFTNKSLPAFSIIYSCHLALTIYKYQEHTEKANNLYLAVFVICRLLRPRPFTQSFLFFPWYTADHINVFGKFDIAPCRSFGSRVFPSKTANWREF